MGRARHAVHGRPLRRRGGGLVRERGAASRRPTPAGPTTWGTSGRTPATSPPRPRASSAPARSGPATCRPSSGSAGSCWTSPGPPRRPSTSGRAAVVHPGQPVVRFELGRAALARRDYARAVEYLSAVLVLVPDATVVHYPLAMAYRGVGDLDRAAHHLERRGGRGTRGYSTGVAVGMPDPLLRGLEGLIETPQSHRDRGLDAAALLDWPEAVRHYRLAVEAEPDYAAMRVNLGTALERVGDARGALAEYDAALALDPGLWEAWYGPGDLLERGGRDAEAIASFRSAIRENPTFVAAHLRLGNALRRTDRLEEALAHYRRVIDLRPGDPGARFGEAMALVRLGRYAEARDRLEEALRVLPDQPMFAPALARVLSAAPDDAVRDGARAWELVAGLADDQQHPGVFETLAMALAEVGHFDLAVDWQRLAMTTAARAGRADVAREMAASLALYARRRPSRTPWRDDDPDHRPGPPRRPRTARPGACSLTAGVPISGGHAGALAGAGRSRSVSPGPILACPLSSGIAGCVPAPNVLGVSPASSAAWFRRRSGALSAKGGTMHRTWRLESQSCRRERCCFRRLPPAQGGFHLRPRGGHDGRHPARRDGGGGQPGQHRGHDHRVHGRRRPLHDHQPAARHLHRHLHPAGVQHVHPRRDRSDRRFGGAGERLAGRRRPRGDGSPSPASRRWSTCSRCGGSSWRRGR